MVSANLYERALELGELVTCIRGESLRRVNSSAR